MIKHNPQYTANESFFPTEWVRDHTLKFIREFLMSNTNLRDTEGQASNNIIIADYAETRLEQPEIRKAVLYQSGELTLELDPLSDILTQDEPGEGKKAIAVSGNSVIHCISPLPAESERIAEILFLAFHAFRSWFSGESGFRYMLATAISGPPTLDFGGDSNLVDTTVSVNFNLDMTWMSDYLNAYVLKHVRVTITPRK